MIFVNENENDEKRENNEFVNKNWNEKMMKTKTRKQKMIENEKKMNTKMPKQQNLSLNESPSIQYGAYECYGSTALNPWLTVEGI